MTITTGTVAIACSGRSLFSSLLVNTGNDMIAQLERSAHFKSAITEEEFTVAKKKLLGMRRPLPLIFGKKNRRSGVRRYPPSCENTNATTN